MVSKYSNKTLNFRLGSNPEKLYPRKAFEKELVKFGKFGMLMAMFVLPIFVSTIDEIPETRGIDKNTSADEIISKGNQFGSGKALDVYKKRIRGVFIDSVRLNYI